MNKSDSSHGANVIGNASDFASAEESDSDAIITMSGRDYQQLVEGIQVERRQHTVSARARARGIAKCRRQHVAVASTKRVKRRAQK